MNIKPLTHTSELLLIKPQLSLLDVYYPEINSWFKNKFLSNNNPDNLALGAFNNDGRLIGFTLGKKGSERKLRCIRVFPEYQSTGIGLKLIERTMDLLECDNPLVTVSEELFHHYSRIFINRYGYELNSVNKGMYRKGKLEYIFN